MRTATSRVTRVALPTKTLVGVGWWHWLVAYAPHTTQPTTQASPPQGNRHSSAFGNVSTGGVYDIHECQALLAFPSE